MRIKVKQTEENMAKISEINQLLQEFWNSYTLLMHGNQEAYAEYEKTNEYLKGIWELSPKEFEYRIAQAKKYAMKASEIVTKKDAQ